MPDVRCQAPRPLGFRRPERTPADARQRRAPEATSPPLSRQGHAQRRPEPRHPATRRRRPRLSMQRLPSMRSSTSLLDTGDVTATRHPSRSPPRRARLDRSPLQQSGHATSTDQAKQDRTTVAMPTVPTTRPSADLLARHRRPRPARVVRKRASPCRQAERRRVKPVGCSPTIRLLTAHARSVGLDMSRPRV